MFISLLPASDCLLVKHIIFCHFEYLEQIPKMRESIDKAKDKKNAIFGENTNIHVFEL